MTYRESRWIIVRFTGRCAGCDRIIRRGDRAFYFPTGRRLLCQAEECSGAASRKADAANESAAVASYVAAGLGEW